MNIKVLFILSLAVNAGLSVALFIRKAPEPGGPALAGQSATGKVAVSDRDAPPPADQASAKPEQKFDWRMVESPDYRQYIAHLRAIGCPEETIRDIIIADVNKLFASRRNGLMNSTNKFSYWKADVGLGGVSARQLEKLQALNRERHDVLRELLGVEVEDDGTFLAGISAGSGMLDFLTADQQKRLQEIQDKFQVKFAKAMNGGMASDETLRQIQKEMDAELAASMSPEDYRQYQLRMSPTAISMRAQLAGLDPSEEEFNKIFDIKKAFDDEYAAANLGANATKEDRDKVAAAQKQMDDQMKSALGEERYAEYERSQDWNYQALAQVANQYDLPKDSAAKVYDMKKLAEAQANAVRKDKSLTSEQRMAALNAIRKETESSVQQVLGAKAWGSYQNDAYWLNGLSARTASGRQQERASGVMVLP